MDQLVGIITLTLVAVNVGLMVSVIYAVRNISFQQPKGLGKQVGMIYSDGDEPQRHYALRAGSSIGE